MPRPVVLLHGWGGSFASTWRSSRWVERLAATGRTVNPVDLPGHCPGDPIAPDAYSDLAAALAAKLPQAPVDIVAFSLGAKIALALVERSLVRVGRLVLAGIGDNVFAPEPAGEDLASALLGENVEALTPTIAALIRYASAGGADRAALAAILRRTCNPVLHFEGSVDWPPILLVNGSDDSIALPDDRLRRALADPSYRRINGVAHLDLTTNTAFQDAALAFLDSDASEDHFL